jgi:L-2,4-diaminobutyrate decarboxylase
VQSFKLCQKWVIQLAGSLFAVAKKFHHVVICADYDSSRIRLFLKFVLNNKRRFIMSTMCSEQASEVAADSDSRRQLAEVFAPQLFRDNAQVVVTRLACYLADDSIRGLALTDPAVLLDAVKTIMDEDSSAPDNQKKLLSMIDLYIKTGIQVHSPGYMGRQFSGVIPLAGVFDLVNSIINQPSSFYEAAQLPNVVESVMADELNQFIGYPPDSFAMVTTSGGSLANLTAILAARNDKFPQFWSGGVNTIAGQALPAIAVSEDSHYSVSRAAGIAGIGADQIIRLPTNDHKQIDITQVEATLKAAKERGLHVFCLVAAVGTTSMGAFDPIDALADICQQHNIWLHVDGAHGASLLLSEKLRQPLKGIERADSFVWDAHKMLFVPSMCTLLFYKDKHKSKGAFAQQASYVFEKEPDIYTEYDSAEQNFECTKRPLIMNLWVCWVIYGKALFANKIELLCELTQSTYRLLQQQPDFTPLHQPQANILCFRYLPQHLELSPAEMGDLQLNIRNQIRLDGKFFISKVDVDGLASLRVVFMNHDITLAHVKILLEEIRSVASNLLVPQ